jgi:hypothetical protein
MPILVVLAPVWRVANLVENDIASGEIQIV